MLCFVISILFKQILEPKIDGGWPKVPGGLCGVPHSAMHTQIHIHNTQYTFNYSFINNQRISIDIDW